MLTLVTLTRPDHFFLYRIYEQERSLTGMLQPPWCSSRFSHFFLFLLLFLNKLNFIITI